MPSEKGSSILACFEMDGAPLGKQAVRHRLFRSKSGTLRVGAHSAPETATYMTNLRAAAILALGYHWQPLEGPLEVFVTAFVPIPASWSLKRQRMAAAGEIRPAVKPDWDNYAKAMDGLNGFVWRDDALIVDGHCSKFYSEKPRLRIIIKSARRKVPDDGYHGAIPYHNGSPSAFAS